ncbi:hypothetical protein AB0953_24105 [Streptomyces sp. NPDC046866]|uniref:hypothetical protein n=1 Tax=Streptomyces sp. NPDC046866 TaxID=3154921 RepID=UPI003451450E
MRLRPTALAFLGALSLALPTAGSSLAAEHGGDDGRIRGRLQYIVEDGLREYREIRPADNDTCYELTGTSRNETASAVRNETNSIAVLFRDRGCNERATRTLEPGDEVHNVSVRSVYFKPRHVDEDRYDDYYYDDYRSRRDGANGDHRPAGQATKVIAADDDDQPRDEPQGQEQLQDQPRDEQQASEEQQGRDEQMAPEEQQGRDEQMAPEEQQNQDQQQGLDQQQGEDQQQGPDQQQGEDQQQAPADEQAPEDEQMGRDEQQGPEQQGPEQQGPEEQHEPDMYDAIFKAIP